MKNLSIYQSKYSTNISERRFMGGSVYPRGRRVQGTSLSAPGNKNGGSDFPTNSNLSTYLEIAVVIRFLFLPSNLMEAPKDCIQRMDATNPSQK